MVVLLVNQGRRAEAVRTLGQMEPNLLGWMPRHPDTITSLNNLAYLYYFQGRYEEAELGFREALQASREVLGSRHPQTLGSLNNLAGLYNAQGRYGEAEPLYLEALQLRREVLGPRHPDTGLDDAAAAVLYQQLFGSFEDKLAAATTVYVAPDGVLNLVPFARLKLADGLYWGERQEVRLMQSGRDLLRPDPDRPARGLLALGGIDFGAAALAEAKPDSLFLASARPDHAGAITRASGTFRDGFAQLAASREEADQVTQWYRRLRKDEPVEMWSGATASKARLLALQSPPRVLHLATHGFYLAGESREPMLLSGIALAGANR
jgi:tetratricopeptide (TPR) repeat protein